MGGNVFFLVSCLGFVIGKEIKLLHHFPLLCRSLIQQMVCADAQPPDQQD